MTMDGTNPAAKTKAKPLKVNNWPMNLTATRQALQKALQRLDRYQKALRLANYEIERRNRGIMALTNFIHLANRSSFPADLLELTLKQALEITGAPVGAIVLIDTETTALTLAVHKSLTTELSEILTGQTLDMGAAVLMPHLVAGTGALLEQPAKDKAEQHLLTAGGLSSLVSLPVRLNARLMGALLIGHRQNTRAFTSAELHFLMILCQETAIALDNLNIRDGLWQTAEKLLLEGHHSIELSGQKAVQSEPGTWLPVEISPGASTLGSAGEDMEHLLAAMMEAEDEVQQHNGDLQSLSTVSEMINSTLSLNEILQYAVDYTQIILQTDAAWIHLLDNDNGLEIRAHTDISVDFLQYMQHLPPDQGIESQVVATSKAHFIEFVPNKNSEQYTMLVKEGLQTLAVIPISRPVLQSGYTEESGHVIGVLVTGKRTDQPYTWTQREIRLLTAITNQLAVAIENAHLYAQVHHRQTSLSSGNEVLRNINDMLLEKNAYLEGFVNDDVPQALNEISQILQYVQSGMAPAQQKKVNHLQTIVQRLGDLSKEAGYMSTVLDEAFEETIDDDVKQSIYTGAATPVRLKKPGTAELKLASMDANNLPQPDMDTSKPLSFEDAVAAGLVPGHLVNREQGS